MFCPKCGNQLKDGARFCAKCGVKIGEKKTEAQAGVQQSAATQQAPPPSQEPNKKPKRGGKAVIILTLLLVLVLATGAGTIYYVSQRKEAKQQEKETEARWEETEEVDEVQDTSAAAETTAELEAPTEAQVRSSTATTAAPVLSEPITCSLVYTSQADFNGLNKINIQKANVTQSSFVVQENSNIDNTGWSVFDGQADTSWQEGREDDGQGEYVTARFDREYQIKTLTLLLGNHRTDAWFVKNNRPKTLSFTLGSETIEADFPDEMKEFALVFSSPISASDITVTIKDVYSGTEYRDTVISEIGVYGN